METAASGSFTVPSGRITITDDESGTGKYRISFTASDGDSGVKSVFEKNTSTGVKIMLDIQKNKWYPSIIVNISLLLENAESLTEIESYRLGDFSEFPFRDQWWSIEESKIDDSFLEIRNLMKDRLFPVLERLENQQFLEKFLENITQLSQLRFSNNA